MATRSRFIASIAVVVTAGIMSAPSPSEGRVLTSTGRAQAIESTCSTTPQPSVTTSGSNTHTTPQWTANDCRKMAQHNQQYCRKLKGAASLACYVSVNVMLFACLAKAKG
jgi:hypothetical protein